MVTRLQVGSLTPLPGLAQEETLHRTYFRPGGDPPRAPATQHLLERRSPLRSPLRLPPRLTPQPFSKDQAPDMKSPETPWGPARPAPACGQPQDGAGETLSSSAGQEVGSGDGRRRSSASAFSKASFLQLSPVATIVLETGRTGPAGGQGVRESAPEVSTGFPLERHLGSKPEVATKPAVAPRKAVGTLARPASLLQDPGPVVPPETSPKELPAQASPEDGPGGPALDTRPLLKRRPVSAIYMDSIQLQKPALGDAASARKTPPTPAEKSWVRRPRPLSVDLTARFENREAVLRRGAEEAPARGAAPRGGQERAEPEPKVDGERPVQAEAPRDPDFPQGAPRTPEQKEKKVLLRPAETGVLGTATANAPPGDQTPGDQQDRERGQAPPAPAPRPGKGPDAAEVKSRAANWEARAPGEVGSRGSFWKRVSLAEGESPTAPAAATEPPPPSPGSPKSSETPGPGRARMSVQDRIKGWAQGESPEPKLERRRKTLPARPLSVDLTRLFSSTAASPEVGYEKRVESREELPQEPGGKKEAGHVPDAVTSPRSPWKPGSSGEKVRLPEWPGQVPSRYRGGGGGSPGSPGPATVAPEADGSFQTVRATLFEHRVEKHTVATASVAEGLLSGPRPTPRPERALWLGNHPPEDRTPRPEACKWLTSPDVERSARGTPPTQEPRTQHPSPPETSPLRANGQTCGLAPRPRPEPPAGGQKGQPLLDVGEAVGEGAGHRLGDRRPSWGRPTEAPSWGRDARPGADGAVVLAQKADAISSAGLGAAQGGEAQRGGPALKPLVQMRKAGPSDQRQDSLRRRTLPYDAGFKELSFLGPEPCRKVEQGRSDQLLDVGETVGERTHSQAAPGAPGDAAMTLRSTGSRHWSKGGQRLSDTAPGHPKGRPEGPGSRHTAILIWEVQGAPNITGPKVDSQDAKGTCPSPRWTRATSWHQAGTVASAESGQERAADVPRLCEPVDPWVRTSVTSEDPPEGRRGASHRLRDRRPSWGRPTEAPSWGRDARPGANGAALAQKADAVSSVGPGAAQGGEAQRGVPALEPPVRMRKAGPSDQRQDRLRRRTLPSDVRFEELSFLAPEPCRKVEQGRSEQPGPYTAATRDPPVAHRAEPRSPGSPRDQALAPGKPASPAEPRATFFAVTYQIPSAQIPKSTKPEAPGPLEPSRKTAPPPSPHLTSPLASVDRDEALEPEGSRSWTRDRERDGVSLSKAQMPPSVHPRPGPRREADEADALRGWEERPGFQKDRKDGGGRTAPGGAPQANPSFKSPKASDLIQWGAEMVSKTLPSRAKDGYRSSVLDIDALMEEYRKQPARGPGDALPSPSAHANCYLPDQPSREWTRRSLKEGREAEGPWTQASSAETNHCSAPTRASYPGAAPSPKSSALLWTVPPSAGPESPRNSVSGPAEDEKRAFASRHHRTMPQTAPVEADPAARGDPDRKPARNGEGRGVALWGGRSPPDVQRTHSEKGAPAQVREGLSVLQDARERQREQPQAGSTLPPETSDTREPRTDAREPRRGLGLQDLGPPQDGPKVRPLGEREQRPRQASPVTASPRRSHSFCRDKRSGPLVDQLKQCFSRRVPEAKDTDTLVQEADSQYGTWTGQRQSGDSPAPESPSPDGSSASARKQPPSSRLSSPSTPSEPPSAGDSAREQRSASVDRSSAELDSPDSTEAPPTPDAHVAKATDDDFAFIDQTSVLDSSALKTRVQLSKRSRRRAPTLQSSRRSRLGRAHTLEPWEEAADSVWMFKDSTEEKPPMREESEEEEKPPRAERTPGGHAQRTPAFPGVDPAVLKAQLQKRPEADSPSDPSSWTPQPRTPKSPFQPGVLGSRVLPPSMEKDERSDVASPLWLTELKSKKRQSLYENQA